MIYVEYSLFITKWKLPIFLWIHHWLIKSVNRKSLVTVVSHMHFGYYFITSLLRHGFRMIEFQSFIYLNTDQTSLKSTDGDARTCASIISNFCLVFYPDKRFVLSFARKLSQGFNNCGSYIIEAKLYHIWYITYMEKPMIVNTRIQMWIHNLILSTGFGIFIVDLLLSDKKNKMTSRIEFRI